MADPTATLASWRAATDTATDGPWFQDADGSAGVYTEATVSDESEDVAFAYRREDETFIAAARSAMPRLLAFAEAAVVLVDEWEEGGEPSPDWWYARGLRAALAEHLGGAGR